MKRVVVEWDPEAGMRVHKRTKYTRQCCERSPTFYREVEIDDDLLCEWQVLEARRSVLAGDLSRAFDATPPTKPRKVRATGSAGEGQ